MANLFPTIFVTVENTGLSISISPLQCATSDLRVSVASKGLIGRKFCQIDSGIPLEGQKQKRQQEMLALRWNYDANIPKTYSK